MAILNERQIREMLLPYVGQRPVPDSLYAQLCVYLDLLIRWNERTNLTSVREPQEVVQRHFGESLFAGIHLPPARTLLDYGSGAGFPGLPIQLLLPDLKVTLAESQGKKASFLREAIRVLQLATEVWPRRVEAMEASRIFDLVALRAVDKMEEATQAAKSRVAPGGMLVLLLSGERDGIVIPGTKNGIVRLIR